MRNLGEVISQMLEKIPADQTSFIGSLKDMKSSFEYTSPETIQLRWKETMDVVEDNLGINIAEWTWQKSVLEIWMDTSWDGILEKIQSGTDDLSEI